MKINEQQKRILIYIGMFGFYVVAFWGVIKSWYMADDLINYTTQGYCINNDISVLDLTIQQAKLWYTQVGRCFIFSSYTYIFFSVVKNVYLYKFIIVLMTFLDGVLLSKIVGHITSSKKVQFLILFVFPALISLDCGYFNAMYGFHMLLQVSLLWCLLSMLSFLKYLDTNKWRWQIISCCFLSIGLGSYEVSYVLCVLFPVIALAQTKSIAKTIKKIIPQTVTGILWLIWNVVARMQASSEYVGTKMNLGIQCVEAFLKQLSGSSSVFSIWNANEILSFNNIKMALTNNGIRYFFLVICVGVVFVYVCRHKENIENARWVYVIGLLMAVGPAMLVAISQRYQNEISWGRGYLPAFVSCWGIVICLALFIAKLKNRYVVLLGAGISYAMLLVFSQMVSDITVEQYNQTMTDPFVAESVESGVLDEFGQDDILVDGCGSWSEFDSHYAFLLQRKANANSVNSLYQIEENTLRTTDVYDTLKEKKYFFYAGFQKDQYYYLAKCFDLDIGMGEDNSIYRSFRSNSFDIYIPNQTMAESIVYITQEGDTKEIVLNQCNKKNKTENGYLYTIILDEAINAETITIK